MSGKTDIREKTIIGLSWSVLAQSVKQGLSFVLSIWIARMLMPEHFGILAMVAVFTQFLGVLSNMGLNSALIQGSEIEDRHFSTTFWVNLTFGLVLALTICGLAYIVAAFYEKPELVFVTQVISIRFLLSPLWSTHVTKLRRALDFRTIAMVEVVGLVVKGITGLLLAYNGYGVWSLIVMEIVGESVLVVFAWISTRWVPALTYDHAAFKELFKFSKGLVGFNIVNYWARNADNLLIGKFLGEASLGRFNKAYSLMLLPLNQVTWVISQVMFPSLSKIKDDLPRVRKIYLKTTGVIILITAPMMLGLMVTAHHVVPFLLGDQWLGMIPILQVLCPLGALQSVLSTSGWIYLSQGRSDIMFRWSLVTCPTIIIGFSIGIWFGSAYAVAVSYLVTVAVLALPSLYLSTRLIKLRLISVILNLVGIVASAIGMAFGVWGWGRILQEAKMAHGLCLAIQIPLGIILYVLILRVFRVKALEDVWTLLQERLSRLKRARKG